MVRFLFQCTPEHSVHHICLHAVLYLKISNSEETEIPFQNVFSMRKILKQNTLYGNQHMYYAVTWSTNKNIFQSGWDLAKCWWDLAKFRWDLVKCGWDLAKWLERMAVNAKVATFLGSIPASSDTVTHEGGGGGADEAVLKYRAL